MPRGLTWQQVHLPMGFGLATKDDARFSSPPAMDIARDVQFEEIGGLQTRHPMAAMSNAIFGGGTLANCRRMAVVNDELCVFTDTAFYSWNATTSSWVLRGTHLAAVVDERSAFVTTDDQVDQDRAELGGTIVYAYGVNSPKAIWVAALDKTTGNVLMAPTALTGSVYSRPRLVALATKILLFVQDDSATSLKVIAIDPASPATAVGGALTTVLAAVANFNYDVVKAGTQDLCVGAARRTVTTSYTVFSVTPALAVTAATKARTCDGPIAIAALADGTQTEVVRVNGVNVQGDLLTTSSLADVFTGQAFGASALGAITQVAACFRSVQDSGQYRCFAFWSDSSAGQFTVTENWADTGNSVGASSVLTKNLAVGSRAFDHNGQVYVWLAFAQPTTASGILGPSPQNTYFLYRDDAFLTSKSTIGVAGGYAPSTGRLPGVANTGGKTYAWCGSIRRSIPLGNDGGDYGPRSPRDISVTFDSDQARRTAGIGRTLYLTGSEILQYDGVRIVEVGFHVYPYSLSPLDAAGGSIAVGTYACMETWRYVNAQNERERSTTTVIPTVAVTGSAITFPNSAVLNTTHKLTVPPAIEFWRTAVAPNIDSPFYLTSSLDPSATTNPNRYFANTPTAYTLGTFNDFLSDASLTTHETNPENGGVLESIAPPPARIMIASDTRIYLAGIAGDPDRVWYSRERNDGEIASFHDGLTIDVPPAGGDITALWLQDGVLYVGRETAVYAIPGDGLNNLGQGPGYGPAQIVSLDVGPASHEALCLTPVGTLMKGRKGWYLMDHGRGMRYVGAAVAAFDADTVSALTLMTSQHQVRVVASSARVLIWDYRALVDIHDGDGTGRWAEWTIGDGLHAVLWNGSYVYLTATGPKIEQGALSSLTYGMDVESSWIKINDLQGFAKMGEMMILGEYRSACLVRMRLARDYQYDGAGNVAYFEDLAWSPNATTVGGALQVRHAPSAGNADMEALKVRITATSEAARATLVTSALSPQVTTSGAVWTSTWRAERVNGRVAYGEMGNALSMSVSFASFTAPPASLFGYLLPVVFTSETGLVLVRDNYAWSYPLGRWVESANTIGVLVAGSVTVGGLEASIAASTTLASLTAPDPTPSKTINVASMLAGSLTATRQFSGGSYAPPTGEAFKLTGIAVEVGLDPRLYKRLPAEAKI